MTGPYRTPAKPDKISGPQPKHLSYDVGRLDICIHYEGAGGKEETLSLVIEGTGPKPGVWTKRTIIIGRQEPTVFDQFKHTDGSKLDRAPGDCTVSAVAIWTSMLKTANQIGFLELPDGVTLNKERIVRIDKKLSQKKLDYTIYTTYGTLGGGTLDGGAM